MNENFENNFNESEAVEVPEQQPQPVVEPEKKEEPIIPNYVQRTYGNYGNTNQYMPYGNYVPYNKPEAEKKPSKGKKKGVVIAFSLDKKDLLRTSFL